MTKTDASPNEMLVLSLYAAEVRANDAVDAVLTAIKDELYEIAYEVVDFEGNATITDVDRAADLVADHLAALLGAS